MLDSQVKSELVNKFGANSKDTGKTEVQIAIFTERIKELTDHVNKNKKDNHTRRGLINLVSKRRKLLDYLANNDIQRYRSIIADLGLRK
jgi:small subunit ribosomal protein S15